MEDNSDKVIRKFDSWPGVDKAMIDFQMTSSVKMVVTKITKKMFKKSGMTFIGIQQGLSPGEVVQLGDLGLKYFIVAMKKNLPEGGYLFRIKRIDGNNVTLTDIDATHVGGKVQIISRRPYSQIWKQTLEIMGVDYDKFPDKCEEDIPNTEFDCTPTMGPIRETAEPVCCNSWELIFVNLSFDPYYFDYTDCNGETQTLVVNFSKNPISFTITAPKDSEFSHSGLSSATNQTPEGECL